MSLPSSAPLFANSLYLLHEPPAPAANTLSPSHFAKSVDPLPSTRSASKVPNFLVPFNALKKFSIYHQSVTICQSALLRVQMNDSNHIVPSIDNDEDVALKNKRDFKYYFQLNIETRLDYLLRVSLLLYDNLNAGDFYAINHLISDAFLSNVEIETLGPKSIQVGRDHVFNYFLTLLDQAPDLFVTTDSKPALLHDRVVALNVRVRGTKIDYSNNYLDTNLKYYMDQMSSTSSSAVNLLTETNTCNKFTSGHNKRTYREFVTTKQHVCFNLHFTVNFVLNTDLTHVVKFIKILKSVKLSVPRESSI
jgi:hypothetical protein